MINSNQIFDRLGTGAPDFPAGMPTVGGDPIVESGSNSDGNWTRWADGTQHCTGLTPAATGSNWSATSDHSFKDGGSVVFPLSFIDTPILGGTVDDSSISARSAYITAISADNLGINQCWYAAPRPISSYTNGVSGKYIAQGRWK